MDENNMAAQENESPEERINKRHPVKVAIITGSVTAVIGAVAGGFVTNYMQGGQIVGEIARRFDFVDESGSLNDALESLYAELDAREDQIHRLESDDAGQRAIASAEASWDAGEYVEALETLAEVSQQSSQAYAAYVEYSSQYVEMVLGQVDDLTKERDYDGAGALLDEAIEVVEDPARLEERRGDVSGVMVKRLDEMKIGDSRRFEVAEGRQEDTAGNAYAPDNVFVVTPDVGESYAYGTFYIGGEYSALRGRYAVSDETPEGDDRQGTIEIRLRRGDSEEVAWTSPVLGRSSTPGDIPEIDLTGVDWLEIRSYRQEPYGGAGVHILLSGIELYS